jgi:hypothetical protein
VRGEIKGGLIFVGDETRGVDLGKYRREEGEREILRLLIGVFKNSELLLIRRGVD